MNAIDFKSFCLCLFITFSALKLFSQQTESRIVYQSLSWAPDNKSIAFTAINVKSDWSDFSPEKWGLFIYNLKKKTLLKLDSVCLYLSYSPDGKKIAYDKLIDGNADIYTLDLNNLSNEIIVNHESKDRAPSWSPDGKSIVYYSDRSGHEELYFEYIKSGKVFQLTNRENNKSYNPVWSPNSDQIVYYLEKGDNKDQIYLTDSKGSFQKNLTNDDHHNVYPSWTPDGKIIYSRDGGELMIMDIDGSNKRRLLEKSGGIARMSPTGNLILTSNERNDIVVLNLNSGENEIILKSSDIYK